MSDWHRKKTLRSGKMNTSTIQPNCEMWLTQYPVLLYTSVLGILTPHLNQVPTVLALQGVNRYEHMTRRHIFSEQRIGDVRLTFCRFILCAHTLLQYNIVLSPKDQNINSDPVVNSLKKQCEQPFTSHRSLNKHTFNISLCISKENTWDVCCVYPLLFPSPQNGV